VFDFANHFHPSLIFASKGWLPDYVKIAPLRLAYTLYANVRLGLAE